MLCLLIGADLAVEGPLVCVDASMLHVVSHLIGPVGTDCAGIRLGTAVHVAVPRHLILHNSFHVAFFQHNKRTRYKGQLEGLFMLKHEPD